MFRLPILEMAHSRYLQHLLWAPMTLFFCALHPSLWMCATVSSGRCSIASCSCHPSLVQNSHRGLARAPIISSHFPRGKEHVITCVARLLFASLIAPALIHSPRNSLLSPTLSKNSEAQVVGAGVFLTSVSWSWNIHSHPKRSLSIHSHLTPVHATCRMRATPLSVVRENSLFQLPAPLEFSSPLSIRGHSLHAFVLPCVQHSGCAGGPLSTLWRQLSSLSAWVSARSFRGSPRCSLTLTMNEHLLSLFLSRTRWSFSWCQYLHHLQVSWAAPYPSWHLVQGCLTIAQYSRSTSGGVTCSVRATAANSGHSELDPSSSRQTRTTRHLSCRCLHPFCLCILTHPLPMSHRRNHRVV